MPHPHRGEVIAAVRAQAHPTDDGPAVHCLATFTGADWSADGVIDTITAARDVQWINGPAGHNLAVVDAGGTLWRFAVTQPQE